MQASSRLKLIISIAICEGVGIIGGLITGSSIQTWFSTLNKPSFNPPNWIFGPVWTLLYLLMGIAVYLVWKRLDHQASKDVKISLRFFGVQLALNFAWTILFFGLHSPLAAFIDICMLWLAIVGTISVFYKVSRISALLLLPYLAWVSFALCLNYALWQLNR